MHADTPQNMSRALRRCIVCIACIALACVSCAHAEPGDIGNVAQSAEFGLSSITKAADQQTPWWTVKWLPESLGAILIMLYVANIWHGRARNGDIALAFADVFCYDGSLLERNFSQVGARIQGSPDMVLREAMHRFQIFATGRRFCQSFQASLNMQHRQDLFYQLCYLIAPSEDQIDIDITMNEANMEPMVLLIAAPRRAISLAKSLPDVQALARPIDVDKRRLPSFPSDKLTVWAESASVFYDLMTDKVIDLLFGRAAFEDASKYFRHLHFSTEGPEGYSKQGLRFSFKLPPTDQMQDLTKVLTAVMHFIDVSPRPCGDFTLSMQSACHNARVNAVIPAKSLIPNLHGCCWHNTA